jgi:CheY-like chemotaxis protein
MNAAATPSSLPLTILAVDDDPLVCMGMSSMLEELGHAAVMANSGREALSILAARSDIGLVITDVGMSGMNGMELAQVIGKEWPDLPIIFATGYTHPSDTYPEGAAVLGKPFDFELLEDAINRARKR